jgi:Ca-activated chloride channel family protein
MLELAWPWMLLLAPLPWLVRRWLPALGADLALRLPQRGLHLADGAATRASRWPWLLLTAWLLLLLAAARPQHLGEAEPVRRSGRAMMLAVDISGSMSIEDMQLGDGAVSRFAAVRAIAGDFISRRAGDEVGLILFGTRAYVMTPLTFDLATVRKQLDGAAVGLAGRETAIGDAIAVAVKRLSALPARARVLVLLTDGVNTTGAIDPQQAAAIARQAGLRIYTIGIGSNRMSVTDFFGSHTVDPSADLDVDMLTQLATATGGRFFRATDSAQLAQAYTAIDKLEPLADKQVLLRPPEEWFRLPLGLAMLLLLLAFLLRQRPAFAERNA